MDSIPSLATPLSQTTDIVTKTVSAKLYSWCQSIFVGLLGPQKDLPKASIRLDRGKPLGRRGYTKCKKDNLGFCLGTYYDLHPIQALRGLA